MKKEILIDLLKNNEIRNTEQRIKILKILSDTKKPLTASEINDKLLKKDEEIRLSTIYRNLNLFSEKGIIRKLNFYNKEKKYELSRSHHQHLICIKCGEIIPIECPLAKYEKEIKNKTGYNMLRHDLELYGICPQCQEKNKLP